MPLPRHRPNPNLLQSTNPDEDPEELRGDYHFVYRTGVHDPMRRQISTAPEYHSSCNWCLTDLTAKSSGELAVMQADHGPGICTPDGVQNGHPSGLR